MQQVSRRGRSTTCSRLELSGLGRVLGLLCSREPAPWDKLGDLGQLNWNKPDTENTELSKTHTVIRLCVLLSDVFFCMFLFGLTH